MRVSDAFGLGKSQAELDFVDVDTDRDARLFLDPYAIEIQDDALGETLREYLVTYFDKLLETIRKGSGAAAALTSHLSEPRETFLGVSKGAPDGRGIGPFQAQQIIAALKKSKSFITGSLTDLSETELFIDGISSDKLSDLTTNIIRYPLEKYTREQCLLHDIPTRPVAMPAAWNPIRKRWESHYADIPIVSGKPVLLIPKILVRRTLSLDSQEFYNHYMLNFLQQEELQRNGPLVRIFRNQKKKTVRKKVFKTDLRVRDPYNKKALEEFARSNPAVLERYKEIKGALGPLEGRDFDEEFSEAAFAQALSQALRNIPTGTAAANEYHRFMIGLLSFLFYPHLIDPVKEEPIHDGRKRLDIRFVNASKGGFFHRIRSWPKAAALFVPVECKNYTGEVANPELDQLSGRFGHQRGHLGILLCRKLDDRALFTKRCSDTAGDGRGFVIALDDEDIHEMLACVADHHRSRISQLLDAKLAAITS